MNIESLRDSNQTYREMMQLHNKMLLMVRDNIMQIIHHFQIIGIMIMLGGFSILVPSYFSEYIIIEYLIIGVIIIIAISMIFLLIQHLIVPYSLIDDCVMVCNESIIQMQEFRLLIANYKNLNLEEYLELAYFQYQIHLSGLVLIYEKKIKLVEHRYFFHNKEYRIDAKKINDEAIQSAKENLVLVDGFKYLEFDKINVFLSKINEVRKKIGITQ